jgi:hypothetical protein
MRDLFKLNDKVVQVSGIEVSLGSTNQLRGTAPIAPGGDQPAHCTGRDTALRPAPCGQGTDVGSDGRSIPAPASLLVGNGGLCGDTGRMAPSELVPRGASPLDSVESSGKGRGSGLGAVGEEGQAAGGVFRAAPAVTAPDATAARHALIKALIAKQVRWSQRMRL